MNTSPLRQQVIALAAVFQSARLVQQLARHGRADNQALETSLGSILVTGPMSPSEIYKPEQGSLRLGLQDIKERFNGEGTSEDMEMARYVMSLIALALKLRKHKPLLSALAEGIDTISEQAEFFKNESGPAVMHNNIIAKLADLYLHTISTMMPRIIVHGEPGYLNATAIADRIRATLLAGIRAAWLWRQLGGSRWHFVFRRRAILNETDRLLAGNS
ncbi:MAG: high frequency lysogenization protein HflD [Gammaproteobacteria bacterium]|nr:high frequency lysogenization protein HflD [Gammaproteobacteria bacterium]